VQAPNSLPEVKSPGFATLAVRAGSSPDPATGAILTPIFQSSTFVQPEVGADTGYTYTRSGNPTVAALEARLGALEDALPATCTGTGMSALTTLFLGTLKAGDEVLVSRVVYGGLVRLLRDVLAPFGVRARYVDTSNSRELVEAITDGVKMVVIETPANPTLEISDLALCAELCRKARAILAVDNTLMTPALQRPLDLGADVVIHSTTKGIEGHNATVGGALLTRDPELQSRFRFIQNAVGLAQAPFDSFLTLQGVKTLRLRTFRQSESALRIAEWLQSQPRVERVFYPFLWSSPQHALAERQQKAGGSVLSFTLKGGTAEAIRLLNCVRLCSFAGSLGASETLITHPATVTHNDIPQEERERLGIGDGLVRLSVGLEDPDDLIADLDEALSGRFGPRAVAPQAPTVEAVRYNGGIR
jgi:cystathionine beta-lyase/cystathionine gamma-synthase